MESIVLATRNRGKIDEITAILNGLPVEILTLDSFPGLPEVEEDGISLEENAWKKASEVARATNLTALSDDTGLEVFSLGMKPGVISARFAGPDASYEDNYRKLLRDMEGIPFDQRRARFRCVAMLVGKNVEMTAVGVCHGWITEVPKGTSGFGYDPVFLPDGYIRTFGELPAETKNLISHRAKAFRRMRTFLANYYASRP